MKKTVLLCLALLLAFSTLLVSCTEGTKPAGTTTEDPQSSGEAPGDTTGGETFGVPGDLKFSDSSFNILCTAWMDNGINPFVYAEDSALVMDDAIYRRNAKVEDIYGIKLTTTDFFKNSSSGASYLTKNRASGDAAYDGALMGVFDTSALAYQGYFLDLQKAPYVSLKSSWWDQNATADTSIYGQTFYTTGDISYADKEYTFGVIFNKTIHEEKGLEDVYKLSREGKWTLEVLTEMCKTVSEDLDGDDKLTSNDKYGMIVWDAMLTAMINASGNTIASIKDDQLTLTLNNEQTVAVVEQFVSLCQDLSVINFQHMDSAKKWPEMFESNQSLFLLEYLKALPLFRDGDLEYGILPMPKLTAEQDRYYCGLAGYQATMYAIPADCADEEKSGAITEALAYYSKEIVTPAYYEKTLKGKNVQDPDSAETLDIIFANRIYDLGLFYRVGNMSTQVGQLLAKKTTDFASMYASYEQAAQRDIDRINNFFESALEN
ncbi:MAG: extracellular solute-binding protein [Clostridia bacterium]|nr:extracellular solute-binding protein [Clostridia bacterium]